MNPNPAVAQPYKPMVGTCSSAHSAGAAIVGAASAGAASARAASTGAAITGAANAGAASAGAANAGVASAEAANAGSASAGPANRSQTRTRRWRALPHRRFANPKPNPNSEDVTPPEDQRSPSADQGLPQRTSGTYYEPVCANQNLAVACASAPPVCEPEAETEPGGGVRFLTAGLQTRSRTRTRWWRAFSAPPVFEPEADFLGRWRGLPRQRPV
jgi:hypothetical protein